MATITDIEKLAPDLLNKSLAQLEREITERQMAIARVQQIEEEKQRAANLEKAQGLFDTLLDTINQMHKIGYLPKPIEDLLTSNDVFNPARKLKRPRS